MSITMDRPRLTRAKVIDAAADIAMRDGIDGLSMRRLAEELDVSTMAAYRHVPSKLALIEALLLRALDEARELHADEPPVTTLVDRARVAAECGWVALERYEGLRLELRHEGGARNRWADWLAGESKGKGTTLLGLLVGMRSAVEASLAAGAVVS